MAAEPVALGHVTDARSQFRPWPYSHAGDHSSDRPEPISRHRAQQPSVHADKRVGSPLHPFGHCALASLLPRSAARLLSRSDTSALDKLSWAVELVVFGLLRLALCQSWLD